MSFAGAKGTPDKLGMRHIMVATDDTEDADRLFQDFSIRRMGRSFFGLFVLSVPMWWFFELMNSFVHNWHYIFAHPGSDRPDCCINSRRCIVWREGWKQMNTRPFGSYLANLDT